MRTRRRPGPAIAAALAFTLSAACLLVGCPSARSFIFPAPPARTVVAPEGASLVQAPMPGGGTAHALYLPAPEGAPTIVHFHGNGEQLAGQVWLLEAMRERGLGFYAVEYPGYGPAASEGDPTEAGLYAAADAALVHLRDTLSVPRARTVLSGWSLGTGVAAEMAKRGHGERLVLLSPYTSIPDVAAAKVGSSARALIKDHFDTGSKAAAIDVPVLIVHGDADRVIPVAMGRSLAERFPRADLVILDGTGHSVWRHEGLLDRLAAFAGAPILR